MISIQRRLSIGLAAAILVVGLVSIQLGVLLFDAGLRNYFERNLQDEADFLVAAISRENSIIYLDKDRVNPVYSRPYSGRYFVIDTGAEVWRSRSLWDTEFLTANHEGLSSTLLKGPDQQSLLVYRADFQKYGQSLKITIAQNYEPILKSFKNIQYLGLAGIILSLLLIIFLQRIVVLKALKPLDNVRQQVEQLQQGLRSILDKQVPSELLALVAQINQLLAHTENQLKRSRNALGNLGHALKTPLAVLMSVIARPEFNKMPDTQQLIREQLSAIEQLLSRELNKARMAGDALPGSYFNCDTELPQFFEMLYLIHEEKVILNWDAPTGLRLPWNREDMLELLGNLLDNACKWADSTVLLTIKGEQGYYQLIIDDDGPGIAEEQYVTILSRGVRLDEQVTGHGLGLGIVKDIIDSWQGEIALSKSDLGGLKVTIKLPMHQSF